MRNLERYKIWSSYLEDLDIGINVDTYLSLHSELIKKLTIEDTLDDFLILLAETVNLKKNLKVRNHIVGFSFSDLIKSKAKLLRDYGFTYDWKPRVIDEIIIKKENKDIMLLKNPKVTKPKVTKHIKEKNSEVTLVQSDSGKIKLKNSNVFVDSWVYNADSIEQNFKRCKKTSNGESVDWQHIETNLLCKVLMPILNEMYIFNEKEFWEFKKIRAYKRYLGESTFKKHFNTWHDFESYIGVVRESNSTFDINYSNMVLKINGVLPTNSQTKAFSSSIKRKHLYNDTNWISETNAFIRYASIPVLFKLKDKKLTEPSFIIEFNNFYKLTDSEISNGFGTLTRDALLNRSKLHNKDIVNKFDSWDSFLNFIQTGNYD